MPACLAFYLLLIAPVVDARLQELRREFNAVQILANSDCLVLCDHSTPDILRPFLPAKGPPISTFAGVVRASYLDRVIEIQAGDVLWQNAECHLIGECRRLESLDLTDQPIDDDGLKVLRHLSLLGHLNLSGTHVSDTGIVRCLESFPDLYEVNLESTRATDRCTIALGDLARRGRLPRLAVLDFSSTAVTDVACRSIANCRTIRELRLNDTAISDTGITFLTASKGLESLEISKSNLTIKSALALANMRSLKYLSMKGTRCDDFWLNQLATLPNLIELDVRETGVTQSGVEYVERTAPMIRTVKWAR